MSETGNHEGRQTEPNTINTAVSETGLKSGQEEIGGNTALADHTMVIPQIYPHNYPADSHTQQEMEAESSSLPQNPALLQADACIIDLSQTRPTPASELQIQSLERLKLKIRVMEEILEDMKERKAALEDDIKDWSVPRVGARMGVDERKTPRGRAPYVTFGNSANMAQLEAVEEMNTMTAQSSQSTELLSQKEQAQRSLATHGALPQDPLACQSANPNTSQTDTTMSRSTQPITLRSRQTSSRDQVQYDQQFLDIFRTARS